MKCEKCDTINAYRVAQISNEPVYAVLICAICVPIFYRLHFYGTNKDVK